MHGGKRGHVFDEEPECEKWGFVGCRSRLGCQVIATKDIDGIHVRIPGATRNFAVDGYKPKPH